MDQQPKPKKFQTIAEYLSQKQPNTPDQKVTMVNGKLSKSGEIVKWTEQEDNLLLDLMTKRSLGAIRLRIWTLFHNNGGKSPNDKLKS